MVFKLFLLNSDIYFSVVPMKTIVLLGTSVLVMTFSAGFKPLFRNGSSITVNTVGLHVYSFCPIRPAPNFAFGCAEPTVNNCDVANDENV
jgi:hypothetical protein